MIDGMAGGKYKKIFQAAPFHGQMSSAKRFDSRDLARF